MICDEIEIGDGPLTFLFILKSLGVGWVVGGCTLDYYVSSGPFLSFEIEIGDGPGPKLDNYMTNNLKVKLKFS